MDEMGALAIAYLLSGLSIGAVVFVLYALQIAGPLRACCGVLSVAFLLIGGWWLAGALDLDKIDRWWVRAAQAVVPFAVCALVCLVAAAEIRNRRVGTGSAEQ